MGKSMAFGQVLHFYILQVTLSARHWQQDTANQLKELGIQVSIEGVGWDTAYDRAQSTPLMWGWGAHTPMEFYNIYHTAQNGSFAEYSPYSNKKWTNTWIRPLKASLWKSPMIFGKKAQWDGENGVTQDGDIRGSGW